MGQIFGRNIETVKAISGLVLRYQRYFAVDHCDNAAACLLGGRFAQSWRMIAAAAFSLYIADIWFKYATNRLSDYQSGGLLEVFWVFSGVLFGIGAALEYDLSSRSRSRSGRRRST